MAVEEMAMMSMASAPKPDKRRGFYRYDVGDLRTGKISRTVDLAGSWSAGFDGSGSVGGSFPLRSGEWPTARADAAVAKQFLAVSYTDADSTETFLEAGPIWTTDFDEATDMLKVNAGGLDSYFSHRKLMAILAAGQNPATTSITYTAAQLGLIAKRLIELAQSHTGGHLPIVLPDDVALGGAGTDATRTYPGYELGNLGERLQQLREVDGGPEIQFVPRRRADDLRYIEWVMRIGVKPTMMLTQAGPAWIFDRTVPKSPVAGISISSDGSMMGMRAWAAGQGEGEGRPIVVTDDPALLTLGYPLLEVEQPSIDTVSEVGTLDAYTRALLAKSARPIETWTVKVNIHARPNVGQYRPGDWCTLRIKNHIYQPDGDYSMRILSISGDTSDYATLSLSPRLGEI